MKFGIITKLRSAFSLLEISIILTGVSVLITSSVAIKNRSMEGSKYLETKQKINDIEVAVAAYYAKNGYFPCPADPRVNIKSRSVGASEKTSDSNATCDREVLSSDGKFYAGSVPSRELGLSYNYILDGWGNKLTFIVPSGVEFNDYIDVPSSIANTPTNYTNLILWADSSDVATMSVDGSGNILEVNDKSGNGYNLKQDVAGFRPSFVSEEGLPAMSFDGVDDRLYIDGNYYESTGVGYDGSLSQVTTFVVFKTSSATKQIFVSYDGSEYWRVNLRSDGNFGFKTKPFGGGSYNTTVSSSGYRDGNVHILTSVYDRLAASQQKLYIDGVNISSRSPHPSASKLGSGNVRYGYVGVGSEAIAAGGAVNTGASFMDGLLYEVLIYENAFDSATLNILHNYLEAKWQNGDAQYQGRGPFLQINDINGSLIEDQAVFAVISYGPTGRGAHRKGGVVDANRSTNYNVLGNGFDSQSIVTDYMTSGSGLVERAGWKDDFSQVVRYYTVSDIQNLTE